MASTLPYVFSPKVEIVKINKTTLFKSIKTNISSFGKLVLLTNKITVKKVKSPASNKTLVN